MHLTNSQIFLISAVIALFLFLYLTISIVLNRYTKRFFIIVFSAFFILLSLTIYYLSTNRFNESRIYLLTQVIVAFGTISVLIVSIWGEKVKALFNPPNFTIRISETDGEIINVGDQKLEIYFHLRVVNEKLPSQIKDCAVLLNEIMLLDTKTRHIIRRSAFSAPYSFKWALTYRQSIEQKKYKSIYHEATFDFIRISLADKKIFPALVDHFRDFNNFFSPEKYILQCKLQITSDSFRSAHAQYFQTEWNWNWGTDANAILSSVKILEVTNDKRRLVV